MLTRLTPACGGMAESAQLVSIKDQSAQSHLMDNGNRMVRGRPHTAGRDPRE
jgi:hypothetical protein